VFNPSITPATTTIPSSPLFLLFFNKPSIGAVVDGSAFAIVTFSFTFPFVA